MTPEVRDYVIYSRDRGGWWGPNRGGYFTNLVGGAGLYTEAEAKQIEASSARHGEHDVAEHVSQYADVIRTYAERAAQFIAALDGGVK